MSSTVRIAVLVLLVMFAVAVVHAASITAADSRITRVTVYRDRAEVVREAIVQVPSGASTLEFGNIPDNVDADTVRISAEGVPAALGAIEIRQKAEAPKETPEWRQARDEVLRLEREMAMLDMEAGVDNELRNFLRSLSAVASGKQARELGEGRADPEAIRGIYELMSTSLRKLGGADLERQDRRRQSHEDLQLARARMETLRPASGIRSRVATVEVETERAGRLTVRLAYLAPGASWRPAYRATLDPEGGRVDLVSEGVVRQGTGEDWNGVELFLSSAAPARGVKPPMLMSWILSPRLPVGALRSRGQAAPTADAEMYQNTMVLAPAVSETDEPEPATVLQSGLVRSAYNVAFKVPGGSDVPADGRDHRVVLRRESLKANLVHRTVPEMNPAAFLTAVTTSPDEYPLLSGPVRVFAGGAFLGSYQLRETGPAVELTVPFGMDNRVEIIRVPEPEMKSREGFTGKYKQVHKYERTIINNLMDKPVTLVLEDRIPVPEDDRIEVEIGKQTTPGYSDSEKRPGVKLWTLELEPREKTEVILEYTVRYPREMVVPGIE